MSKKFNVKYYYLIGAGICALIFCTIPPHRGITFAENTPNPQSQTLSGQICKFWKDPQGLTHVRATQDALSIACWGYLHARDRIWEMDFLRRTVQGRRAEITGATDLKSDFSMRLMDLSTQAAKIFPKLSPQIQAYLWNYTHGVNQGIPEGVEKTGYYFKEKNYSPEPWSPVDSLALMLLQSLDQTRKTFRVDLDEESWKRIHGENASQWFTPDETPWDTSILKEGEYLSKNQRISQVESSPPSPLVLSTQYKQSETLLSEFLNLPPLFQGSNNWVVAPSRSRSQKALLANDPHLRLHLPSVWHWSHIEGKSYNFIGASVPGIPVVVSGANSHVSWGLTNAYLKVGRLGLVPEKTLQKDPTIQSLRPLIWFRLWKFKLPFFFKTHLRPDGPYRILPIDSFPEHAVLLDWVGFQLDANAMNRSIQGLIEVMSATNATQADWGFSKIDIPTWNFVFSDSKGKIGYRAVGRVPKMETPQPFGILPFENLQAFIEQSKKQEFYTPEEMPHVFDPRRGYVVTGNNRHWPLNSRFFGGRAYQYGFRANRIEELLMAESKHTVESFRKMQCDNQAVDAKYLLPEMLKSLQTTRGPLNPELLKYFDDWKKKNYHTDASCRACTIYRLWIERLMEIGEWSEAALYRQLKQSPTPTSLKTLVQKTWDETLAKLKGFGEIPTWEKMHVIYFNHLSGDSIHEHHLSTPGDEHSVNPGTGNIQDNGKGLVIEHFSGASQRVIIEMSSPPQVFSILPGSFEDTPRPNLLDPQGPWMKWKNCELEKRVFPVDWSQVETQNITL